MTRRQSRIDFQSYDGQVKARIGSGDHCALVQIEGKGMYAGIVLTDDEAEQLGRNLVRMAWQSRQPSGDAA